MKKVDQKTEKKMTFKGMKRCVGYEKIKIIKKL